MTGTYHTLLQIKRLDYYWCKTGQPKFGSHSEWIFLLVNLSLFLLASINLTPKQLEVDSPTMAEIRANEMYGIRKRYADQFYLVFSQQNTVYPLARTRLIIRLTERYV